MSLSEFELIERFFQRRQQRGDVVLGIGDDAAVLRVPAGRELVVAVDTLLAGRHFPDSTSPFDIARKALAVNLSDLAAMGAEAAWFTLSLTLPAADENWLQSFAEGLFSLADDFELQLVGGDTTRGPLSVTIQVQGFAEPGMTLRRQGALPGQAVFVTGTLGDAACALQQIQRGDDVDPFLLGRLNRPDPRLAFGRQLATIASSAIDISDGLLADLGHILEASNCGATLWVDRLPASEALQRCAGEEALVCQLSGGDDYELCFTLDEQDQEQLQVIAQQARLPVSKIGVIEAQPGIRCLHADGSSCKPHASGFDHFENDG